MSLWPFVSWGQSSKVCCPFLDVGLSRPECGLAPYAHLSLVSTLCGSQPLTRRPFSIHLGWESPCQTPLKSTQPFGISSVFCMKSVLCRLVLAPKCVKSQNQLPFHTIKSVFRSRKSDTVRGMLGRVFQLLLIFLDLSQGCKVWFTRNDMGKMLTTSKSQRGARLTRLTRLTRFTRNEMDRRLTTSKSQQGARQISSYLVPPPPRTVPGIPNLCM